MDNSRYNSWKFCWDFKCSKLYCSTREACWPELRSRSFFFFFLVFLSFFYKSKGFKRVEFHSLICFQLLGRGRAREEKAEQLKSMEAVGAGREEEVESGTRGNGNKSEGRVQGESL